MGVDRADPDRACQHEDFVATVEIVRQTGREGGPVIGYMAEIRVHCVACDEPFRWVGVEAGMMPGRPMCSVDETELRAPLRPASADPDFGLGIPGFAVRFHERQNDGTWVEKDEPLVTRTGRVLTDDDIEALADEAERGHEDRNR